MIARLSALMLFLAVAPAYGQGWIEPPPNFPGRGVTKLRTSVHVTVVGRVAEVVVEEWFRNDGGGLGEGDYIYPLPGEAVFSNFSLYQGDQELRGETMNADRARNIYETIVRQRRDPALIELVGHGLIRARVFPIAAGETRRITLRYSQILPRAGDALQFRYAAGRRSAGTPMPVRDGARIQQNRPDEVPLRFVLETEEGESFRDPFSPTHDMDVERRNGNLRVTPEGNLRGDLTLFLPLVRTGVGMTVATHRPDGEPGYFMLTLSPGDPDENTIEPRDITAVVDVSGSMSGEKMDQAKSALHQLLGSLREQDRFRLIAFNNRISSFESGWTRVTRQNRQEAERWIDRLVADGGTNIDGALDAAFNEDSPADRLPIVVFMTDGLPSVGEENPERIAANAEGSRGRARVFAFGIGYDVNTYLLDRLSAAGRGSTAYVEPSEDVEQALGTLVAKIQHPVLTDLELAGAPVDFYEIYPVNLPDLFAGEEIIIFGRYEEINSDRTGEVRLRGLRSGRQLRFDTEATFEEHTNDNDFIPRLWASRKLGHLTRQVRIEGRTEDLVEEIRETAMRYGLLSEYTSYLVQEPGMVVADNFGGRPSPQPMPVPTPTMQGQAPQAASGAMAVQRSQRSRALREAESMTALDEMAAEEKFMDASTGSSANVRRLAGRTFSMRDGIWMDAAHGDSLAVTEIEPFSAAYFAILEQLPELAIWLREFEEVLIAGAQVSIKFTPGGETEIAGRQLGNLVRQFRAR